MTQIKSGGKDCDVSDCILSDDIYPLHTSYQNKVKKELTLWARLYELNSKFKIQKFRLVNFGF